MKKFTKISLITALVLAVAGAVLAGAGVVSGASFQDFAESAQNSNVVRNWFENAGWLYRWDRAGEHFEERMENWGDNFEEHMENWGDSFEDHMENWGHGVQKQDRIHRDSSPDVFVSNQDSVPADQVEQLTVEAYAGNVEIKPGTGDEIKISNLTDMDTVEFEADDRELYISRTNEENNQEPLVIEIPEGKVFQELDLQSSASNLAVSGKIQAKETSLCAEAGNLKVELLDSRETDVECYAGNLKVKNTGKLADYTVELETDSCKVNLDGETYSGWQEGSFGARNAGKHIDVEADAGNIDISFEQK